METIVASKTHESPQPKVKKKIASARSIPFFAVHVAALVGIALLGWSWKGFALALGMYAVRMFFVTAGYHRYFAHGAFKTSRPMQFLFALGAMSSSQKGVLWWAAHHRSHHKYSDQPGDLHSAALDGLFWSHMGWILSPAHDATDMASVREFAKYPELRWLNRYWAVPPTVLGVSCFLIGGFWGLVWGFLFSTALLWHGTFSINSLAHMIGRRRYSTKDESRNSFALALITLGEGWHNNHHYYQRSVRQGFYWWEIDMTYYVLKMLEAVGLVWGLHVPSERVKASRRVGAPSPTAAQSQLSEATPILSVPSVSSIPVPADAE